MDCYGLPRFARIIAAAGQQRGEFALELGAKLGTIGIPGNRGLPARIH